MLHLCIKKTINVNLKNKKNPTLKKCPLIWKIELQLN